MQRSLTQMRAVAVAGLQAIDAVAWGLRALGG
jgi:hypothetical protein